MLEALYVQVTLHECRQGLPPDQPEPHPAPESFSDSSWSKLDQVLLSQVFDTRFRVLQSCPDHFRGRFRQAARCALEARLQASIAGDLTAEHRAWKLFCLLPFMLLRKPIQQGRVEKSELCRRFDMFNEGKWKGLVEEGISEVARGILTRRPSEAPSLKRRAHVSQQKFQQGEVSRARALAPGTEATFTEMQNKRPQVVARELSEEVRDFVPDSPVTLDRQTLLHSLKTAPRGSSPGAGGCTYEHIKILLDDSDTFDFVAEALNSLARASVPREISRALMGARLTALRKPDGGVRGIATGTTLRRIVGRTLAKQFSKLFKQERSPLQHGTVHQSGHRLCGTHDSGEHRCRSCSNRSEGGRDRSPTIMCFVQPCWEDWSTWKRHGSFCHLCRCRTPIHQATSGSPTMGSVAQSPRQKEGNRETL